MKLMQVKGNTWVLEGMEYIPLYRLDEKHCILLDSGLGLEQQSLVQALEENGLTPVGILCSHAHVDHAGNNRYFQETYHIPVALTPYEAGMCSNLLSLKCYFLLLPPDIVEREASCLIHTPDVLIPMEDGAFSFAGADFTILHTPGHSAGHISIITPDNVCYVGDALLSWEQMEAKLPYALSHRMAMASREKLRTLPCDLFIMAHQGVAQRADWEQLLDANQALTQRRAEEILSLVTRPMTASEIGQATCAFYKLLTHKPSRALRFERNIRFLIEYLVDTGRLIMETAQGTVVYRPARP